MRDSQFSAVMMTAAASTGPLEAKASLEGLWNHVKETYKSPDKWAAPSMDKLIGTAKEMGKELKREATVAARLARRTLRRTVTDSIAAEAGSDISMTAYKTEVKLAQSAEKAVSQLSRFSVLAKRTVYGLDALDAGIAVANAPAGTKGRTAFEKGMEFLGETAGAITVDLAATAFSVPTSGLSFIAIPAATVGASAASGYMFEKVAEYLDGHYDENMPSPKRNR